MRLFAGVFPPPEAVEHLAVVVAGLGLRRRITPPPRWHITVAFLGDVSQTQEEAARQALDRAISPVGELRLRSGGRFGEVVWVGLDGDLPGLSRLNRTVRRELRAARLHPDDKRFRPHLTIARSAEGLSDDDTTALRLYEGPAWPAGELVLVRSEQGPQPIYHRLGAWPI